MKGARARILIVDDESTNLEFLVSLLQDYTLTVAKNGKQALARAQSSPPPDVIVLDVVMPEMDGFEVCRLLKQDERTRDIPVIFATSLETEADEERGFAAGGADYGSKPYRPTVLKARIGTQVRLRTVERALESARRGT